MNESYCAGLIDGEGCICIKKTPPRNASVSVGYYLNVFIEMADPRPIKVFCDFLDIKMSLNTTRHLKNPIKHRPLFVAHMGVHKSVEVLKKLAPYLIGKKEEAILALEFYELCFEIPNRTRFSPQRYKQPTPQHLVDLRHGYYLKMQALKRQRFETYQIQSP